MYPSTRVILDATEVRVEKPGLPLLQQVTFLNYNSTNTYKVLWGFPHPVLLLLCQTFMPGQSQIKNLQDVVVF